MKIIEWNINHRLGHSKKDMPKWVKEVVQNKKADIIILTETSFKVINWEVEYLDLVDREKYYVFCSNNTQVGNNEVTIAIKKNIFDVVYVKSFFSNEHTYPDHLEVSCTHKETGKKLVIIGMRIHAIEITNKQKKEEFETILKSTRDEKNVIIAGDFNNYRRGYQNCEWCLTKVKELAKDEGFDMFTPSGGSINGDNKGEYSFPEDHIFVKGDSIKVDKLYDYDREFVKKAPDIYQWKTDFQHYKGKDKNGNNKYDKIDDPFPDHAIIEANFHIEKN